MHIDSKEIKFCELIEGKIKYEIPEYQRKYSWTRDEIEDLIQDLEHIQDNDKHFMGVLFFCNRDENRGSIDIVDGQQRITTLFLILNTIREIYEEMNKNGDKEAGNRYQAITEKMMFRDQIDNRVYGAKLVLGFENRKFFEKYILGINKEEEVITNRKEEREKILTKFKNDGLYETNEKLEKAYKYIRERLFQNKNNSLEELGELQKTIYNKLIFVKMEVDKSSEAFMLFETLNERGLALESTDLIKNRLLKNISKDEEFDKYKDMWTSIVQKFEDTKDFKNYLRHFLISKIGYFNSKKMFDKVKDEVKDSSINSKRFIEDLNKEVDEYTFILNPTLNRNIHDNDELVELLDDVQTLNFTIIRPVVLSLFREKNVGKDYNEISRIIKLCLNFLIRYISIGKHRASSIEKIFAECAQTLELDKFEKTLKNLSSNEEFEKNLMNLTVNYKSDIAYYLLIKYEKFLHTNEKWISPGRKYVTVEHILPQTIDENSKHGQEWIKNFGDIGNCKKYTNSIGNLALLGQKGQNKASNKMFKEKRKVYDSFTDMKSAKEIANYKEWNEKSLNDRQKKMIKAFLEEFEI